MVEVAAVAILVQAGQDRAATRHADRRRHVMVDESRPVGSQPVQMGVITSRLPAEPSAPAVGRLS